MGHPFNFCQLPQNYTVLNIKKIEQFLEVALWHWSIDKIMYFATYQPKQFIDQWQVTTLILYTYISLKYRYTETKHKMSRIKTNPYLIIIKLIP